MRRHSELETRQNLQNKNARPKTGIYTMKQQIVKTALPTNKIKMMLRLYFAIEHIFPSPLLF